jgi:hypothetical protein
MIGHTPAIVLLTASFHAVAPELASAQSIAQVLSFLMTNRSISTGDFIRDERAAMATSDAIADLLTSELGTVPLSSSASGFTYRLEPSLGTSVRASDSFGPVFTERTLTVGRFRRAFGLIHLRAAYHQLDGRPLRDGTLVATAAQLRAEREPFDVETVSLRLHSHTTTLSATVGLTDRLDVGVALPFVRITLDGQRVDTYRGQRLEQAVASGSAAGLGDVVVRTKYQLTGRQASGLAVAFESRLPTGNEDNLLGSGSGTIRPVLIGSLESARVGTHVNIGYSFGEPSDELNYSTAVTVAATPRLTGFGEIVGRRVSSAGRIAQTTETHPTLIGVDTLRLTAESSATSRLLAVMGVKWNVAGGWLFGGTLLKPLTTAGLIPGWAPMLTLDYSFGG